MSGVARSTSSIGATVGAAVISMLSFAQPASAEEFTAGVVLRDMEEGRLASFLTGVIEGLAYARYMSDGKQPEGAKCIYDWFYAGEEPLLQIYAAFAEHSDAAPASVVAMLIERECGT